MNGLHTPDPGASTVSLRSQVHPRHPNLHQDPQHLLHYLHLEQPPTSSHGTKTPAPPAVFPPHSTPDPWTNTIDSTWTKYSASNHLSPCPLLPPSTKSSASLKPEFPKGLCGPLLPLVCQASSFLPTRCQIAVIKCRNATCAGTLDGLAPSLLLTVLAAHAPA